MNVIYVTAFSKDYSGADIPDKPLIKYKGTTLLEHTLLSCYRSTIVDTVIVLTDSEKILKAALGFDSDIYVTNLSNIRYQSNTHAVQSIIELMCVDRKLQKLPEYIISCPVNYVNVLGRDIDKLFYYAKLHNEICTLCHLDYSKYLKDINRIKVVISTNGRCIYFSRNAIPYQFVENNLYLNHVGIYCFPYEKLKKLPDTAHSGLAGCENLEQLAWIEHNKEVYVQYCNNKPINVDYAEYNDDFEI